MNKLIYPLVFFYAHSSFARSALSVTKRIESQGSKLGFQIGIIGLLIAGVYFALGKHDAGDKLSKAIVGIGIIIGASVIAGTIQTWVR